MRMTAKKDVREVGERQRQKARGKKMYILKVLKKQANISLSSPLQLKLAGCLI